MEPSAPSDLVELAEEPSRSLAPEPGLELRRRAGYLVALRRRRASVERVRLGDVEQAVAEVRALARERGLEQVTWWVGERSTPPDLAGRLRQLGLEPGDPERMTTLVLAGPPRGRSRVAVRPVETVEDYLRARAIEQTVWPEPGEEEPDLGEVRAALARGGRSRRYLALLAGEPVGFARAVFTPAATLLLGGAVLPHARGRGAYTALVRARWDDSADRGVPRLLVAAGPMSAPILVRLGFERLGEVHLLRDRLARPPAAAGL
jgi:GNAT superfamily N-acetyltransferase